MELLELETLADVARIADIVLRIVTGLRTALRARRDRGAGGGTA